MTSDWREIQLGEVARFKAGSAFKLEHQGQPYGEIPFIKVSDLNLAGNEHAIHHANNWVSRDLARQIKAAIHPAGATVFAKIGIALTYNRRRLLVRETVIDNNMMSASPDENATTPHYLYFLLQSLDFNEIAHGSALPYLNVSDLQKIEIELPPLAEQRAIAKTLGALDDRIDNLRQTNTTLQAIAAALFTSWFVDFDGVTPENMQESGLGLIPKGWRIGTLANLCEINAAKWTDKKHPPTVRYIDLSGVSSNRIEAVNELAFDEAPSRARLQLREGDTIVGTVRPGNRAFAYIHAPDVNLTGSTGFAVLSPNKPHYASFVYLAATRDEAIERLANLADGAAYPAVRPNVVAETPCVIAPDAVIAEFSANTKPLLERIQKNSQQAAILVTLRNTLLPRLISGRLRVHTAGAE